MDQTDSAILNTLQEGFPVCERPYAEVARQLGIEEDELLNRLRILHGDGILSRFGPMYHAERLGGALTLAAMKIPENDFDKVTELVNSYPEVAHNYARDHELNMWFVLATDQAERIVEVLEEIQARSGFPVYNMPKEEEYFVGLKFKV